MSVELHHQITAPPYSARALAEYMRNPANFIELTRVSNDLPLSVDAARLFEAVNAKLRVDPAPTIVLATARSPGKTTSLHVHLMQTLRRQVFYMAPLWLPYSTAEALRAIYVHSHKGRGHKRGVPNRTANIKRVLRRRNTYRNATVATLNKITQNETIQYALANLDQAAGARHQSRPEAD